MSDVLEDGFIQDQYGRIIKKGEEIAKPEIVDIEPEDNNANNS